MAYPLPLGSDSNSIEDAEIPVTEDKIDLSSDSSTEPRFPSLNVVEVDTSLS